MGLAALNLPDIPEKMEFRAMESANKFICHTRMKRSGAWWVVTSGNSMLRVRCAMYNGTFERVFTKNTWRLMAKDSQQSGYAPLASAQCRFRAPLTYPDTVSVGARIARIGKDRFKMEHLVVSHQLGKTAAEGDGTLICYDYGKMKKALIPEDLRQRILDLEKGNVGHL